MVMCSRIYFGCFVFLSLYIAYTSAKVCGQTQCDETEGGYCCAKESSKTAPKDCCCMGTPPTSFSISCHHSSSVSVGLPTWAAVIIALVVLGVIGGVIVGVIMYMRKRQRERYGTI